MSLVSGKCPNCDSDEIYQRTETNQSHILIISSFRLASVRQFVCADCGYIEKYVEKRQHLELIRQKWKPVNKKRKRKRKNDER